MFELFRSLGVRGLAAREALPLGASLVTAELFYKFHSFLLESIAFLATWFVLDAAWAFVMRRVGVEAASWRA